jgi:hypothetical protein
MKLIYIAKRRLDGLIDENWIAGFEAYQSHNDRCPHLPGTEKSRAGWRAGPTRTSRMVEHTHPDLNKNSVITTYRESAAVDAECPEQILHSSHLQDVQF